MKFKHAITILALLFASVGNAQALSVKLAWAAPTTYEDSKPILSTTVLNYNVFRATKADVSDAVKVNLYAISGLTYSDTSVVSGMTYYYYVVTFVISTQPSKPSSTFSVLVTPGTVPPSKPTLVTVTVQVP